MVNLVRLLMPRMMGIHRLLVVLVLVMPDRMQLLLICPTMGIHQLVVGWMLVMPKAILLLMVGWMFPRAILLLMAESSRLVKKVWPCPRDRQVQVRVLVVV